MLAVRDDFVRTEIVRGGEFSGLLLLFIAL